MPLQTTALTTSRTEYVTVMIGGQLFGLPIFRVHDVFVPDRLRGCRWRRRRSPASSICAAVS